MAFTEGGAFKCYIHDFTTDKIAQWDKHCLETGHTQSGEGPCVFCGTATKFTDQPYVKLGMARYIVCKNCEKAQSRKGKK